MNRRASNRPENNCRLVSVHRLRKLGCYVNTRQLDELANYIGYVESLTGDKPTEGEVVGAALAELFNLDRGFRSGRTGPQEPDSSSHNRANLARAMLPQSD